MHEQHLHVLKSAIDTLKDRGARYNKPGADNPVEESFTRAAAVASLWLDRPITPRDVALILASVKIARTAVATNHQDSFVDLVNYVSFGASFSGPKNGTGAATGSSKPTSVSSDLDPQAAALAHRRALAAQGMAENDLDADNQRLSGPFVGPKNAGQ